MGTPQGIYHTGSKDYLGDKATMLSSRWTQKQQNTSSFSNIVRNCEIPTWMSFNWLKLPSMIFQIGNTTWKQVISLPMSLALMSNFGMNIIVSCYNLTWEFKAMIFKLWPLKYLWCHFLALNIFCLLFVSLTVFSLMTSNIATYWAGKCNN